MEKTGIVKSLLRAGENYCRKIDWVIENKPEDRAELACLYAGIGGIKECIRTLEEDDFIDEDEKKSLAKEMDKLFAHCQIDRKKVL